MSGDVRKPLEERSAAEMRERAREYRLLAATATTANVRDALRQVGRMLERRAAEKEAEGGAA